jgi:hypothetical protein
MATTATTQLLQKHSHEFCQADYLCDIQDDKFNDLSDARLRQLQDALQAHVEAIDDPDAATADVVTDMYLELDGVNSDAPLHATLSGMVDASGTHFWKQIQIDARPSLGDQFDDGVTVVMRGDPETPPETPQDTFLCYYSLGFNGQVCLRSAMPLKKGNQPHLVERRSMAVLDNDQKFTERATLSSRPPPWHTSSAATRSR